MSKWRLPNKDELNKMYKNLHRKGIGNFANVYYWSSSKYGSYNAWLHNFGIGRQATSNKDSTLRVRAVRTFEIKRPENFTVGRKQVSEGVIFDIQGNTLFVCKEEDEKKIGYHMSFGFTWHEAMELFKDKKKDKKMKRENIKWVVIKSSGGKRILLYELDNGDAITIDSPDTEAYCKGSNIFQTVIWADGEWEHLKEPTYKPYTELTEELAEKLIGMVVKNKHFFRLDVITACQVNPDHIILNDETVNLEDLFKEYTFIDGSPIGEEIKED